MGNASMWDLDEHQRRRLMRQRAAYGASLALGHVAPEPEPEVEQEVEARPVPPPLNTIPAPGWSNWQVIVDEVLQHHGFSFAEVIYKHHPDRPEIKCLHEIAYRLAAFGTRAGSPITLSQIGRLLHRHHTSIRHARRMHARRIADWGIEA